MDRDASNAFSVQAENEASQISLYSSGHAQPFKIPPIFLTRGIAQFALLFVVLWGFKALPRPRLQRTKGG